MAYHTHWLCSPIFSYHRLHTVSVRLQCVLPQVTQCFLSRGYNESCHSLQCFLCVLSQVTMFLVAGYNVSCCSRRLQCVLSQVTVFLVTGYSVFCQEVTVFLVTDYSVFYTFLVTGYSVSQVKMFF